MGLFKKKQDYTTYEADDYYPDTGYQEKPTAFGNPRPPQPDAYYQTEYEEIVVRKKLGFLAIAVLVLGVYVVFLVIGVFSTSFIKDEVGNKNPQVITLEMREERESYGQLKAQYKILEGILLDIQELDAEFASSLSQDEDKSFMLSTKYQEILPRIDKQLPKVRALVVHAKYEPLRTQVTKVYTDISYYLQKMAKSLSEKNGTTLQEAISWNLAAYADFSQLRFNMGEFAKIIKLDDSDVSEGASPESMFATSPTASPEPAPSEPAAESVQGEGEAKK